MTNNLLGCVRDAMPTFHALRDIGCVPFLPQLSIVADMIEHNDYETWLDYDFDIIWHCAAVFRLPGESPGADRECAFAKERGIPTFTDITALKEYLYYEQRT